MLFRSGGITEAMASSFDDYRRQLLNHPELGFSLDLSRAPAPTGFAERLAPALRQALADMAALEQGAIANPDEKRMVGHYWLRAPELAPDPALGAAIRAAVVLHLEEDLAEGRAVEVTRRREAEQVSVDVADLDEARRHRREIGRAHV